MTDILEPKLKHCENCKYCSYEDYGKNECKSPSLIRIDKDGYGSLIKVYPKCEDVLVYTGSARSGYYEPCDHFNRSFWFTLRDKWSKIQEYYYKKRHPEWFI